MLNGQNSVAFQLAHEGYDVWLGNNRGTLYSRKHIILNPSDPEDLEDFFNYTFTDMGKYDVPATITYILENTNQPDLTYIGHS